MDEGGFAPLRYGGRAYAHTLPGLSPTNARQAIVRSMRVCTGTGIRHEPTGRLLKNLAEEGDDMQAILFHARLALELSR